jgi:hypothetical protein
MNESSTLYSFSLNMFTLLYVWLFIIIFFCIFSDLDLYPIGMMILLDNVSVLAQNVLKSGGTLNSTLMYVGTIFCICIFSPFLNVFYLFWYVLYSNVWKSLSEYVKECMYTVVPFASPFAGFIFSVI